MKCKIASNTLTRRRHLKAPYLNTNFEKKLKDPNDQNDPNENDPN